MLLCTADVTDGLLQDWHLPDDEFVSHVDNEAVEFHCIECIHSARDAACVMTGFRGDDDAKLIPCASCPRVFDASLVRRTSHDTRSPGSASDVMFGDGDGPACADDACYPEGIAFDSHNMCWQCTRCAAAASSGYEHVWMMVHAERNIAQ